MDLISALLGYFGSNLNVLISAPIPFLAIALLAGYVGYRLARAHFSSQIAGLRESLGARDERLKFADERFADLVEKHKALESQSSSLKRLLHTQAPPAPTRWAEVTATAESMAASIDELIKINPAANGSTVERLSDAPGGARLKRLKVRRSFDDANE